MTNNPLVSIVVCCYNRRHTLEHTMQSVFSQHYKPVEIVVLDDGSTDSTPDLIATYGDRVRYNRQENQGIAVTRTNACRLTKGEFIAFQDDDDLMPPQRISTLMKALDQYPSAVLAVGDWAFIDSEGNLTGKRSQFKNRIDETELIERSLLIEDGYTAVLWPCLTPVPHTTLFRRADGERIDWFDPHFFHACSDTDFFARLGRLGPIVYVPEIVSYYRYGHSSIWKKKYLSEYSRFLLFEKHLLSLRAEQKDLRKRLQFRMLQTIKLLAYYSREETKLASLISKYSLKKGLSLIGIKNQIELKLWTLIRLPILRRRQG